MTNTVVMSLNLFVLSHRSGRVSLSGNPASITCDGTHVSLIGGQHLLPLAFETTLAPWDNWALKRGFSRGASARCPSALISWRPPCLWIRWKWSGAVDTGTSASATGLCRSTGWQASKRAEMIKAKNHKGWLFMSPLSHTQTSVWLSCSSTGVGWFPQTSLFTVTLRSRRDFPRKKDQTPKDFTINTSDTEHFVLGFFCQEKLLLQIGCELRICDEDRWSTMESCWQDWKKKSIFYLWFAHIFWWFHTLAGGVCISASTGS